MNNLRSFFLGNLIALGLALFIASYSSNHPETKNFSLNLSENIFSPFEFIFKGISSNSLRVIEGVVFLREVVDENDKLITRIKNLESENLELREASAENKRLKEILEFKESFKLPGIVANVKKYYPLDRFQRIQISRGASSGVDLGDVVSSGAYLIGRVIALADHSADVMLLSDSEFAADAVTQGERRRGIVFGRQGELKFEYLESTHKINVGERVVTSGLDGVYPKGLILGAVEAVVVPEGAMFLDIKLAPVIDLQSIETVLIFKNK